MNRSGQMRTVGSLHLDSSEEEIDLALEAGLK